MNPPALALQNVFKRFGRRDVLVDLTFEVPNGSICGFVGPNGAGKTTTFSIVCGYLKPDQGKIDILGKGPFQIEHHRGKLTSLPQDAIINRDARLWDVLRFYAAIQKIPASMRQSEVLRVLEMVNLTDRMYTKVRTLSHGMRRRLEVAQAFLGTPELVLLDEPTNGLDPKQAYLLREALMKHRGLRTLLISSHNLVELEQICDYVIMIDQGKMIQTGQMAQITGQNEEIKIVFGNGILPIDQIRQTFSQDHLAWNETHRTLTIRFAPSSQHCAEDVITQALRIAIDSGAKISSVSKGTTLEKRFMEQV